MDITFKCKCGIQLQCATRLIGRAMPCPSCSYTVNVPRPSESMVRKAIRAIPNAFPTKSSEQYLKLVDEIRQISKFNAQLAQHASLHHLAGECVDDACRMLRNIAVYLTDTDSEVGEQSNVHNLQVANALASVACGTDFGGIGTAKTRSENYRRWLASQAELASDNRPTHPLHSYVIATISEVKSFVT